MDACTALRALQTLPGLRSGDAQRKHRWRVVAAKPLHCSPCTPSSGNRLDYLYVQMTAVPDSGDYGSNPALVFACGLDETSSCEATGIIGSSAHSKGSSRG
jgi:hypothetical protein